MAFSPRKNQQRDREDQHKNQNDKKFCNIWNLSDEQHPNWYHDQCNCYERDNTPAKCFEALPGIKCDCTVLDLFFLHRVKKQFLKDMSAKTLYVNQHTLPEAIWSQSSTRSEWTKNRRGNPAQLRRWSCRLFCWTIQLRICRWIYCSRCSEWDWYDCAMLDEKRRGTFAPFPRKRLLLVRNAWRNRRRMKSTYRTLATSCLSC